jgi:DNA polymerase-1
MYLHINVALEVSKRNRYTRGMSNAQPKILLLDSNALIHRSYHALPPLTNPKGEQVNAVYGFAAALLKAIQDEKPEYVVACYDVGKETFRNEIYPLYKAHRKESSYHRSRSR